MISAPHSFSGPGIITQYVLGMILDICQGHMCLVVGLIPSPLVQEGQLGVTEYVTEMAPM